MNNVRTKLVAVEFKNGKCVNVCEVKNLTDSEYKKLVNESQEAKDFQQKLIANFERRLRKLEKQKLFLAKSIYDNFVDRGQIENNDEFQQKWYDFVLGDLTLDDLEDLPQELKTIYKELEK